MSDWQGILETQLQREPPELSIEEAVEIYSNAQLNELTLTDTGAAGVLVPGNLGTYFIAWNFNYPNDCTIKCLF